MNMTNPAHITSMLHLHWCFTVGFGITGWNGVCLWPFCCVMEAFIFFVNCSFSSAVGGLHARWGACMDIPTWVCYITGCGTHTRGTTFCFLPAEFVVLLKWSWTSFFWAGAKWSTGLNEVGWLESSLHCVSILACKDDASCDRVASAWPRMCASVMALDNECTRSASTCTADRLASIRVSACR